MKTIIVLLMFSVMLIVIPFESDGAAASQNTVSPKEITPGWLNYNAGKIQVDGNYAFVAGGFSGIHVFDISDPKDPVWHKKIDVKGEAKDLVIKNGYAFVAGDNFTVIDIDPISDAHPVKLIKMDESKSEIKFHGGTVYVSGQRFLTAIDINPPENSRIIKNIKTDNYNNSFDISNGHAYITGPKKLLIFDIKPLESAHLLKEVNLKAYKGAIKASNEYVVILSSKLQIIDINPPSSAKKLNEETYHHFKDIEFIGNDMFVGLTKGSISLNKISSDGKIENLKSINYSWNPDNIAVSGNYVYVSDSSSGLYIVDFVDMSSTDFLGTADILGGFEILWAMDRYAYLVHSSDTYLLTGVGSLDSPVLEGKIDLGIKLTPNRRNYPIKIGKACISGDYAIAPVSRRSLNFFDIIYPPEPRMIKSYSINGISRSIDVDDKMAFVANSKMEFHIIDIDPPEEAETLAKISALEVKKGEVCDISYRDGYAYVALGVPGLQIIDAQEPENAATAGFITFPTQIERGEEKKVEVVKAIDGYILVAENIYHHNKRECKSSVIHVVKTKPFDQTSVVESIELSAKIFDIYVIKDIAWLVIESGLVAMDISSPGNALIIDTFEFSFGNPKDTFLSGDLLYITQQSGGLRIIDLN